MSIGFQQRPIAVSTLHLTSCMHFRNQFNVDDFFKRCQAIKSAAQTTVHCSALYTNSMLIEYVHKYKIDNNRCNVFNVAMNMQNAQSASALSFASCKAYAAAAVEYVADGFGTAVIVKVISICAMHRTPHINIKLIIIGCANEFVQARAMLKKYSCCNKI